jgi:hypothetical protein
MLGGVSFMAASSRDDLLVEFAKVRADTLPPTISDLAVFQALNSAITELSTGTKSSAFEPWQGLATAKNPLWRLLALRAAMFTTSQAAFAMSSEDSTRAKVDGPFWCRPLAAKLMFSKTNKAKL